MISDER